MSLGPGTRLGPYEIVAAIGVGGMGEVYRARDARLQRDVAIKVLPTGLSPDPDRLARFEQEARAAAALNHPNILAVYDVGQHDGVPYLATELLEGDTLRAPLNGGALPVRKAIEYAVQIAKGLAAAHDKGIVHRDLKPENIFVTSDERVKVLDFGLAKLTEPEPAFAGITALPTTPPHTLPGIVLGTIGYMSPEQVRGVVADHRSDIFALGAIVYEMLAGRRAFSGEMPMDAMTAIMKEDPKPLPLAERNIPPALERIVMRCLEKSPAARFKSADDLAFALESFSTQSGATAALKDPTLRTRGSRIAWVATGAFAVAAAAMAVPALRYFRAAVTDPSEMRLEIATSSLGQNFSISPDGRTVAFVTGGLAATTDKNQLWLRQLQSETARPIAGTENAAPAPPAWSPDSRAVVFFADQKLKRIDIATGAVQTLADAPAWFGASWSADGVIVASLGNTSPLYRLPAAGGQQVPATRLSPQQTGHRYPVFLPDGRHFLFFGNGAPAVRGVYVGSIDSTDTHRIVETESRAEFWPPDYIVFARQEALVAQHLDLRRLEVVGQPVVIAPRVWQNPGGNFAGVAVSASVAGPLVYRLPESQLRQLRWLDRSGKEIGTVGEPDTARKGIDRLSPDGASYAIVRSVNGSEDLWLMDTARGTLRRLTSDALDARPIWSPDGSHIAYESFRNGKGDFYQRALSGSTDEVLLESDENKNIFDWSPDGRFILYASQNPKTGNDLWALPLDGDRKPFVVVQTEFEEFDGHFSPDGRWIAYRSSETGRSEIYVRPFPGSGRSWQVSANGGIEPAWRRDGREIFYRGLDGGVVAVSIVSQTQPAAVTAGTPVVLFRAPGSVVPSPDGQRFLADTPVGEASNPPITVLLNWHGGK